MIPSHLESVGPAATTGLLELAALGPDVRLDGVVGVQVVDAKIRKIRCNTRRWSREGVMNNRASVRAWAIDLCDTKHNVCANQPSGRCP